MTDVIERARAIINTADTHPDPEGAMERLEDEAKGDDLVMFPALWEALALKLNETPAE